MVPKNDGLDDRCADPVAHPGRLFLVFSRFLVIYGLWPASLVMGPVALSLLLLGGILLKHIGKSMPDRKRVWPMFSQQFATTGKGSEGFK